MSFLLDTHICSAYIKGNKQIFNRCTADEILPSSEHYPPTRHALSCRKTHPNVTTSPNAPGPLFSIPPTENHVIDAR
jgi:hypothetical protein